MTPGEQMGGEAPHESHSALVTFLYLICRDLIQCGEIEKYVIQAKPGPLTNRFLAEYAENMEERLRDAPIEEPPEIDPRIVSCEDALARLLRELQAAPESESVKAQLSLVEWLILHFGLPDSPGSWDRETEPVAGAFNKPLGAVAQVDEFMRLEGLRRAH